MVSLHKQRLHNVPIQSPETPMLGLHCSVDGPPATVGGSSVRGTASVEAVVEFIAG